MKELTIWKDEQFRRMRAELDRLYRDFLCDFADPELLLAAGEAEAPRIEMSEDDEAVLIRMAFPGVEPADLEIAVSPEVVLISAERREQVAQGAGELRRDTHFSQRIKLPCRVEPEAAEAYCLDHRLELRLPKSRAATFRKVALRGSDHERRG